MSNYWFRIGDIFEKSEAEKGVKPTLSTLLQEGMKKFQPSIKLKPREPSTTRYVAFENAAPKVVRHIRVVYEKKLNQFEICLSVSPLRLKINSGLRSLFLNYFNKTGSCVNGKYYKRFLADKGGKSFIEFINKINPYCYQEISSDLLKELNLIFDFANGKSNHANHVMSTQKPNVVYFGHPLRLQSSALIDLLINTDEDAVFPRDEFIELLREGENPNQTIYELQTTSTKSQPVPEKIVGVPTKNIRKFTVSTTTLSYSYQFPQDRRQKNNYITVMAINPLYLALQKFPHLKDILALLLSYGADAFRYFEEPDEMAESNKSYLSTVEKLLMEVSENNEFYQLLIVNQTKLYKPVPCVITLSTNNHVIETKIQTEFDKVETHLQDLKTLSEAKIEETQDLVIKDKRLGVTKEDLQKDFLRKNLLIERIVKDGKLIGFNLFQKYITNGSLVLIHLFVYLLARSCKIPGLMELLSSRIEFSIQLLDPSLNVSHLAVALNEKSYGLINHRLHFPMYQPSQYHMDNIIECVKHLYGNNTQLMRNGITGYIDKELENLTLKVSESDLENDLTCRFFYKYLLGFDKVDLSQGRAAVVYNCVGYQDYVRFKESMLLKLQFDLSNHLLELAEHLKSIELDKGKPVHKNKLSIISLSDSNHLFWRNKKVLINSATPIKQIRSKL